ncbi:MAG: iron-sulfur cluster assembly scaffold protein, partial [Pseudomonadota bacterium]
ELPRAGRLEAPDGTATARAPLCGSTVTVDIATTDGRVSDYAANVKACALGQAAASVVAHAIIGCTPAEVTAARDSLRAMLKSNGPAPQPPFDGLNVLRAAQPFANRHASILLALDAAVDALSQVRATA